MTQYHQYHHTAATTAAAATGYNNKSPYHVASQQYGKEEVRLMKVTKVPVPGTTTVRHELREVIVRTLLLGKKFEDTYLTGDNRHVIPTDTQKNTVYVVSKQWDVARSSIEEFALMLARHFLALYQNRSSSGVHLVEGVNIEVRETLWERLHVNGQEHSHAFERSDRYTRLCNLKAMRGAELPELTSSIRGLRLVKTTQSSFEDYHKCANTTLPEAKDRMMRTDMSGTWTYTEQHRRLMQQYLNSAASVNNDSNVVPRNTSDDVHMAMQRTDYNKIFDSAVRLLTEQFAGEPLRGTMSASLQATVWKMGSAVLDAEPLVANIHLLVPNMHVYLFNLAPFNTKNDNDVWWPADEPHGLMDCLIERTANPTTLRGRM